MKLRAAGMVFVGWSLACGAPVCPDKFTDVESFPATCSCPEISRNTVFGTDRYMGLSSVCAAAVHAGVSSTPLTVFRYDDCDVFVGSERGGFESSHWHEDGASYGFAEAPPECVSPFDVALGETIVDREATCDNSHAVDEICKRAQDGTDNPRWFTYVEGARLDCPCRAISTGFSGTLIPAVFRSRATVVSEDGVTPLQAAAGQGHEKEVRFLLEHGASPNAGTISPLQTALALDGSSVARPRIAMLLVKAGADVAALDFSVCEDGASESLSCATLEKHIRP